ncbi:MAG: tRNA (adenosine(37)-N6)-threonylcarbamoyltransferase complex ATPase subunit type 1 TsaE [bacterium]|nr:tRNA (adenosine(37)-N6)-threonylcarbamoyltransferase complex ATPase subunit type 1 TsaE [bacterium]
MAVFTSKDIKDTEKFAAQFIREISKQKKQLGATVVGLSGELGSGKTAFVKGVAQALGVKNTVTSPTFVLEKIYTLPPGKEFSKLVHIDAYRLEDKKELNALNWDEVIEDSKILILIEWPECVKGALPKDAMRIEFRFVSEHTREIRVK